MEKSSQDLVRESAEALTKRKSLFSKGGLVVSVAILALFALFFGQGTANGVSVRYTDEAMILTHKSDASKRYIVRYEDVVLLEEITDPDFGEQVGGDITKMSAWAIMNSKSYGEYTLIGDTNITSYVRLTTKEGTLLYNIESEKTVHELYLGLSELCKNAGYVPE